jgi:hypothetical protein
MFLLLRQNMELISFHSLHERDLVGSLTFPHRATAEPQQRQRCRRQQQCSLPHEKDLVVYLHSRIGQPSSHKNTSAAGANNNVVIQRHVTAIAAEHGTNSVLHFIVSYMKVIWILTVYLHSRIGQPPSHSNTSTAGANNNVVIFSFQLNT